MLYTVKKFFWRIKNIIRWFPILWRQFDFDYRYSIDVFRFQLQKTAEFLESDKAWTLNAKDRAKRIRTVIKLMDKVYEEEYGSEYVDKMEEKWGKDILEWVFTPCEDKPGYPEISHNYDLWDNKAEIDEDWYKFRREAMEKQRKAHRILWQLIEKDIQGWWD